MGHTDDFVAILEKLPPRLRQVYRGLLVGMSEKEIAHEIGVSVHTAHEYTKALHTRFGVNSRGELLAAAILFLAARCEKNALHELLGVKARRQSPPVIYWPPASRA